MRSIVFTAVAAMLSFSAPVFALDGLRCESKDPSQRMEHIRVELKLNERGLHDLYFFRRFLTEQGSRVQLPEAEDIQVASNLKCRFSIQDPLIVLCGNNPLEAGDSINSTASITRVHSRFIDWRGLDATDEEIVVGATSPWTILRANESNPYVTISGKLRVVFNPSDCVRTR